MTENDSVQPWMKAAEEIVRQLEVDEPMSTEAREYTTQWIHAIIAEHAKDQSALDYGSIPDETQKYTPEQWAAWRFGFKCGQDWQQATWTKGKAEAAQSTPYKEKK